LILDYKSPIHGVCFSLLLSSLIRKMPLSDPRWILRHPVEVTWAINGLTFPNKRRGLVHALKAELSDDPD
jgi:hypothetical protein